MHLSIYHKTHYIYRAPVMASYNELRLRPATTDERRLEFYLLKVHPPSRLQHFRDEHLNYVQWFEVATPHLELLIEANSRVFTNSQYEDGRPMGTEFTDLSASQDDSLRPFLSESRYISLDPELWRQAVDVRDGRTDVFATAEAIMNHIFCEWRYDASATDVSTPLQVARERKAGVCQDFAQVMIGMCRSLGIPTRYVSGYLYGGANGQLRGAQASHAWCEIHLPGRGWFGLDPTNNCLADERFVKIATGRDYDDAAPVRGTLSGPKNATLALDVMVEVELA